MNINPFQIRGVLLWFFIGKKCPFYLCRTLPSIFEMTPAYSFLVLPISPVLILMNEKNVLPFFEVVKKWGLHLFLLRYLEASQGLWHPILLSFLFSKCTRRFYMIPTPFFFCKQSIFDPRPENCLRFSKKSLQKLFSNCLVDGLLASIV